MPLAARNLFCEQGSGPTAKIIPNNFVDTLLIMPQYLVLRMPPAPRIGWHKYSGPTQSETLARGNRSRRKVHGNEEESQKEETLTVSETKLRRAKDFQPSLSRAQLLRGVSFFPHCGKSDFPEDRRHAASSGGGLSKILRSSERLALQQGSGK